MTTEKMLLVLLALPFAGSIVAGVFFKSNARNAEAWFAGALALAALGLVASAYPAIAAGHVLRFEVEWLPAFGVDFALRVDGFAWMFALLVTGIGFLVVL